MQKLTGIPPRQAITTITHTSDREERLPSPPAIHLNSHLPNLCQNWSATKKVQLSSQQRRTMNTALSLRWMWPSPPVKEVAVRFWIRTTALCAFLHRIIRTTARVLMQQHKSCGTNESESDWKCWRIQILAKERKADEIEGHFDECLPHWNGYANWCVMFEEPGSGSWG